MSSSLMEAALIANAEAAKRIVDETLSVTRLLDESLSRVRQSCPNEESKKYALAIGYVLAEVFERVLDPIWALHPNLKPSAFKG